MEHRVGLGGDLLVKLRRLPVKLYQRKLLRRESEQQPAATNVAATGGRVLN